MTIAAAASVLGHAAFHIAWIGTLVALAGLGALRAAREMPAAFRYAVALWTLVLIAATAAVVSCSVASGYRAHLRYASSPDAMAPIFSTMANASGGDRIMTGHAHRESASDRLVFAWMRADLALERTIASYVFVIAGASWAIGSLVALLRLLRDARAVRRILRTASPLTEKQRLALVAGVEPDLRVVVSDRVDSPCLAGWRRPVAILPARALAALSERELRSILFHEAAHAVRNDYLVNVVQRVVEAGLWFHPALRLISAIVRDERERVCDEAAVARMSADVSGYVEALVRVERLRRRPVMRSAMSVAGTSLTGRVRYLVRPRRSAWSLPGGLALAMALVALLVPVIAAEQAGQFGAMDVMVR